MPPPNITDLRRAGREKVADTISALFAADDPLASTMNWPGDPGLFGPDSASWQVIGDMSAFVGGIRALLVQATHPEVVAGVEQHSRYRQDPLGRLGRTSAYVTATTFGARPEVEAAIAAVSRAHRPVHGTSHRGRAYDAADPALLSWVHNVLVDSFLAAYQAYGPRRLDTARADTFVAEQAEIGRQVGADDLPCTASELTAWIGQHQARATSPGLRQATRFLQRPPLPLHATPAYQILLGGALETLDPSTSALIGLRRRPGSAAATRLLLSGLRAVLGPDGPSRRAALERCAAGDRQ